MIKKRQMMKIFYWDYKTTRRKKYISERNSTKGQRFSQSESYGQNYIKE